MLNFRAKHVKNNAIINKDVSEKAMLSAYQQEIKKLREQLQRQGTDNSPNTHQLSKLEQEKQKAEQLKVGQLNIIHQSYMINDLFTGPCIVRTRATKVIIQPGREREIGVPKTN